MTLFDAIPTEPVLNQLELTIRVPHGKTSRTFTIAYLEERNLALDLATISGLIGDLGAKKGMDAFCKLLAEGEL